jgi:hypothetical protein
MFARMAQFCGTDIQTSEKVTLKRSKLQASRSDRKKIKFDRFCDACGRTGHKEVCKLLKSNHPDVNRSNAPYPEYKKEKQWLRDHNFSTIPFDRVLNGSVFQRPARPAPSQVAPAPAPVLKNSAMRSENTLLVALSSLLKQAGDQETPAGTLPESNKTGRKRKFISRGKTTQALAHEVNAQEVNNGRNIHTYLTNIYEHASENYNSKVPMSIVKSRKDNISNIFPLIDTGCPQVNVMGDLLARQVVELGIGAAKPIGRSVTLHSPTGSEILLNSHIFVTLNFIIKVK